VSITVGAGEIAEYRDAVRGLLGSHGDARTAIETEDGVDRALWRRMVDELGVPGLTIPDELGGSGYGLAELAVVCEEAGRSLACVPLLASTVLATSALLHAGGDLANQLLRELARGEIVASLLLDPSAKVATGSDGPLVSAVDPHVLHGHIADVLVIAAGDGLYVVDATTVGVSRRRVSVLDLTRPAAAITLEDAPARLVGPRLTCGAPLDQSRVALAAEAAGGAEALLEMTVDYAKARVQFGRPIGSFQAIKHRCADMLVAAEGARSLARATAALEQDAEFAVAAALARAWCCDAFADVAGAAIQIHGGIGFTWEHDAHLYLRRAKSLQHLFGGCDHDRRLAAEESGW
jgi:alkylation response protein AidB-like acyl-CoA dehydrogenase